MNSVTPAVAPRFVFSAMFTGIAMMIAVLWMPATLGALAQAYGLGTAQLSRLAFAELAVEVGAKLLGKAAHNPFELHFFGLVFLFGLHDGGRRTTGEC